MAVVSKEIMKLTALPATPCSAIIHPQTSVCLKGIHPVFLDSLIGCSKYLIPIFVLSTLIKYKLWTKEYLLQQLESYTRTALMGCCIATCFNHCNCILRNLLGEFTYYTISFIPAFIGGFGVFIESPKRRPIIINAFTNWGIQGVLASLYNRKILPRSISLETLLFMSSNAYLMYHLQQNPLQLWVFRPPTVEEDSTQCTHEGECHKDVTKGYLTYFGFGFTFEIIRTLIMNFKKILSSPSILPALLFKKNLLRLGNFLGLYVAIYKLVCCSLRNVLGRNDPQYSILAGFLAGQAYRFMPQHSFLAPVLNQTIQSVYRKSKLSTTFLSKVPVGELMMALSNAYLFHLRVVDPESCPSIFSRMMNVCSRGM